MHWTLGPEVLAGLLGSILGWNTVIGLFFILSISGLCSCFGCLNFFWRIYSRICSWLINIQDEPLLVGVFNSIFYSLVTGNTWLENTSCCVAYWHCHPQLCHYNSGGINTSVHDSDSALCQVWPDFSHQHCCINFLYPHNMCSFVVYYGSGEIPSLPHNFS